MEDFDLFTRKGVFPYEYVDCIEKLEETELPSRELFYSSLTGDTVSESDYAHAVNVWQRFSIQTLGEYSDLYLKTDVLLLADIFENFRDSFVASYGLDPTYYYTLPGFTWDAMLKHTRVNFELLTDVDMVLFIERGIRGGLSQCSNRYARANNKYMQSYDPSKPSTYLMYFDVNNLYGWAMCQPLPYADFRWVDDVDNFNVMGVALDSPTGYILEMDLEYPEHLHDVHVDLPFCPTRDKPPGKREDKLLATLYDKKRYVIHYRNLQQCIRHGFCIAKVHRILQFTQSLWLRDCIELNTKFRTLAKNEFEKNLYKLMNNAVFGKTMENVRNHVDVRLITRWDGRYSAEAMIAKPNFHSRSVFSENLVAIEMSKLEVKFDKPIYVGMCILDISKTCLYEFHHEYMLPLYREKCKIMYTDTDSLIYYIECDNVYGVMKRDINKFDTSDYAIASGIPYASTMHTVFDSRIKKFRA
ncbi:DNA polymerase-like [Mycetomoellerius zeteki]|uniref:DNA polymerase-like n=1 Tax=Mycetomoellerius zeteki TaxID=64791 RepID=UPI00084E3C66|nr:PREDICTED: DNA polymerase-like [Trachymyrmex zeteki]